MVALCKRCTALHQVLFIIVCFMFCMTHVIAAPGSCTAATPTGTYELLQGTTERSILTDTDGSGPGTLALPQDCAWHLTCPSGKAVSISSVEGQITNALNNYMQLRSSDGLPLRTLFASMREVISPTQNATLQLSTYITTDRGMTVKWRCVDAVVRQCSATATPAQPLTSSSASPDETLMSDGDGYGEGDRYANWEYCAWRLSCDSTEKLEVWTRGLGMETNYDGISFMRTTPWGGRPIVLTRNGGILTGDVAASTSTMVDTSVSAATVVFHSDGAHVSRGFTLGWKCSKTCFGTGSEPGLYQYGGTLSRTGASSSICRYTLGCSIGETVSIDAVEGEGNQLIYVLDNTTEATFAADDELRHFDSQFVEVRWHPAVSSATPSNLKWSCRKPESPTSSNDDGRAFDVPWGLSAAMLTLVVIILMSALLHRRRFGPKKKPAPSANTLANSLINDDDDDEEEGEDDESNVEDEVIAVDNRSFSANSAPRSYPTVAGSPTSPVERLALSTKVDDEDPFSL